jgi:putative peptidoglycan lipid II flippase
VPDDEHIAPGESERHRITGWAAIVASGTLLSRCLGLGRDVVLAAKFPRAATDAFWIAFTIPNVLRQLLAEGATQNAVLPVLAKTRAQDGEKAARELFRALRGFSLLVLAAVTVAGVVGAPWLVDLFAAGFRDQPGQRDRAITLTRCLFPYIFFMGTGALGVAALNEHRRFVVTAYAPGLLNLAFIAAAILLPGWLMLHGYEGILAMAIGALVGGVCQVVAQWPSLNRIGYLSLPSLAFGHPGVRDALRRMGPVLFGIGIYYIDVVIARRFLSELGVGALSYFSWALRLCDFPQGIFVMALQAATLPSLSLLFAQKDQAELTRTFAFGMQLTLFVGIGTSALFVALAHPLVVLAFQRGQFDSLAAQETARALMAQGIGIWTVAATRQLLSVFFATGDTRTPVIVSAADLMVFIALAVWLKPVLGHVGISLAVSGSSAAQMLLLWLLLPRRMDLQLKPILSSALRTAFAALLAAGAGFWVSEHAGNRFSENIPSRLLPGVAGALTFTLVFFAAAWLLRSPELSILKGAFGRKRQR